MKNQKKINYIVGKNAKLNISLTPFNKIIIEFLDDLSKILDHANTSNYTDVKALSFYCRKNNILNLLKTLQSPLHMRECPAHVWENSCTSKVAML